MPGTDSVKRILIVEDESSHAELICRAFAESAEKYAVAVAGTLGEAREQAARETPDLALVDYRLPDGRGDALVALGKGIFPVVLLTAYGDEKLAVQTIKAGALDYVIKSPEAFAAMPHTVERALREWNLFQERKRMEEALRQSEERLNLALTGAELGLWDWNIKTGEVFRSQGWADMLGYSLAEAQEPGLWNRIIHPDDKARVQDREIAHFEGKIPIAEAEYKLRSKSGEYLWVLSRGKVVERDKDGKPARLSGTLLNIAARKQAEEALHESEARLVEAQRVAHIGSWELNIITHELWWSDEVYQIFGFEKGEFDQTMEAFFESVHPEDRPLMQEVTAAAWYEKKPFNVDHRIVLPTGEERTVHEMAEVIFREGNQPIRMIGTVQDITERKQAEEALSKTAKLESIGLLAGGIAHDFNNILTAILGNISLAKMMAEGEKWGKIPNILSEAEKASLRAKDLTQQLLTFSKGGEPVKKIFDLKELLASTAIFALRGSNVRCDFDFPPEPCVVEADEGQISQVFNNLIINADQAMPAGGTLCIRAANVTVSPEEVPPLARGRYVKVTLKDQGIGIAEEHLMKIFDPYFTTKQKGSGLGLTTSYSIVKRHSGYIVVESEIGAGTTFHIYLPASSRRIEQKEQWKEETAGIQGKILIMDDEPAVREVAVRMLQHIGHKTEVAGDGAEAVLKYKLAKEAGQPFDVVILDLTIPGAMGGKEAIHKLLEIDPEVKAVVSSGYSTDPVLADPAKYLFRGVVAKPYEIAELKEVLQRVLGERKNRLE